MRRNPAQAASTNPSGSSFRACTTSRRIDGKYFVAARSVAHPRRYPAPNGRFCYNFCCGSACPAVQANRCQLGSSLREKDFCKALIAGRTSDSLNLRPRPMLEATPPEDSAASAATWRSTSRRRPLPVKHPGQLRRRGRLALSTSRRNDSMPRFRGRPCSRQPSSLMTTA